MVSIIVPVYNVKKFLQRCLDSIILQTCDDWECLLIDDGSTDGSGEICDEYANKDKRFRVFHKQNSGVGSARNVGLGKAYGKYVTFVDSDDWVESFFIQSLVESVVNISGSVYVRQNVKDDYTESGGKEKFEAIVQNVVVNDMDNATKIIEEYDLLSKGAPWGKLYSMEIIRKHSLRFPEDISFHEDHYFVLRYLECLMLENFSLLLLKQPYYHYMIRPSFSLTKKKRTVSENIMICRYMTEAVNKLFTHFRFSELYKRKIYSMAFETFIIATSDALDKSDFKLLYNENIYENFKCKSFMSKYQKLILLGNRINSFFFYVIVIKLLRVLKQIKKK